MKDFRLDRHSSVQESEDEPAAAADCYVSFQAGTSCSLLQAKKRRAGSMGKDHSSQDNPAAEVCWGSCGRSGIGSKPSGTSQCRQLRREKRLFRLPLMVPQSKLL